MCGAVIKEPSCSSTPKAPGTEGKRGKGGRGAVWFLWVCQRILRINHVKVCLSPPVSLCIVKAVRQYMIWIDLPSQNALQKLHFAPKGAGHMTYYWSKTPLSRIANMQQSQCDLYDKYLTCVHKIFCYFVVSFSTTFYTNPVHVIVSSDMCITGIAWNIRWGKGAWKRS